MAETVMLDASAPGRRRPRCAAAPAPPAATAGLRLHLAVLRMAGRLAVLLEELAPASQEPAFLRLLAEEAGAGGMDGSVLDLPAAAAVQPVDRVAARLGLDALDLDLLVLAALPGEREGLAAVVRNLHPEHRPAVTGGLAAALAEAGLIGAPPRRHAGRPAGNGPRAPHLRRARAQRARPAGPGRPVRGGGDRPRAGGLGGPAGRGPVACRVPAVGGCPSPRPGSAGGRAPARRWRPPRRSAASSRWWRSRSARGRPRPRPGWRRSPSWPAGPPASSGTRRPRPAGMALIALHALARGVIPVVMPDGTDHLDAELGRRVLAGRRVPGRGSLDPVLAPAPHRDPRGAARPEDRRRRGRGRSSPNSSRRPRPAGPPAAEPADLAEAATNLRAASRLTGHPCPRP